MPSALLVAMLATACSSPTQQAPVSTAYPSAYAITYYDVVNGVPHYEVLEVHRPFDGFDLTYDGLEPHYALSPSGGYVSTATALYDVDARGVRTISGRQPGPPSGDEYFGSDLSDLINRGLAADLHTQQKIAQRTCSLYRFAEPPSGPIVPVSKTAPDHDDLCIDPTGLVLGETWTYHGKVVERRTATDIAIGADAIAHADLPTPPTIAGAKAASAAAAAVTRNTLNQGPLATPPTPSGFQVALPPQLFLLPNPTTPGTLAARSVIWSYRNAADRVITVEVGEESGARLPWSPHDTVTQRVALPALGQAESALRSDGPEIRVALRGGGWVRVRGTVPLQSLIAYAQRLRLLGPSRIVPRR